MFAALPALSGGADTASEVRPVTLAFYKEILFVNRFIVHLVVDVPGVEKGKYVRHWARDCCTPAT